MHFQEIKPIGHFSSNNNSMIVCDHDRTAFIMWEKKTVCESTYVLVLQKGKFHRAGNVSRRVGGKK